MKIKSKPVIKEAFQFTEDWPLAPKEFREAVRGEFFGPTGEGGMRYWIETLEGDHEVSWGDWVIKGLRGEFYPCKPDIFEKSYEIVD